MISAIASRGLRIRKSSNDSSDPVVGFLRISLRFEISAPFLAIEVEDREVCRSDELDSSQ